MAEVLASLKKIGGSEQYTETSLWTNPSPTADFAAQTITLSDSIGNYKYIGIKYCYSKQITDLVYTAIYKTEDLRASVLDNGTTHNVIILGIENASNYGYGRFVGYISDTSIKFTLAYRLNAAGSASNAANPLEILGINELAHGKMTDMASIFASSDATRSVDRGYTSNSSLFTVTDTIASNPTNKITVLEDGNYEYIAMTGNRSTGTGYVKIGDTVVADTSSSAMVVQHGNMYIQANTECLVYTETATSALNTATLTLIKL